ncbi:hypothetical protein YB2330_001482 [Saitoella coloradoensis]
MFGSRSILSRLPLSGAFARGGTRSIAHATQRSITKVPIISFPPAVPTATAAPSQTQPLAQTIRLLRSQPSHYMTVHIHNRPYLLTQGDTVTVHRLKDAPLGSILKLTRVSQIGSRDYTLRASMEDHEHMLDERLFTVKARVVEHTKGPLILIKKTKRRRRHVHTVKHKQTYTVLRISEMEVHEVPKDLE